MGYLKFLVVIFVLLFQIALSIDTRSIATLESGEFLLVNKLTDTEGVVKEKFSGYDGLSEDEYIRDDDNDCVDDDCEGSGAEPPGDSNEVDDEESSFWTPLTITLITVGSVAGVGVIGTGVYFGAKAIMGTSSQANYVDIENEEVPNIFPRARNTNQY